MTPHNIPAMRSRDEFVRGKSRRTDVEKVSDSLDLCYKSIIATPQWCQQRVEQAATRELAWKKYSAHFIQAPPVREPPAKPAAFSWQHDEVAMAGAHLLKAMQDEPCLDNIQSYNKWRDTVSKETSTRATQIVLEGRLQSTKLPAPPPVITSSQKLRPVPPIKPFTIPKKMQMATNTVTPLV